MVTTLEQLDGPPRGAPVAARPAGYGRYGLIPVASTVGDVRAPDRWVGFSWLPEACGVAAAMDISGCGAASGLDIPAGPGFREFVPYGLWAGDQCSPWDKTREYAARARRQLQAGQSFQLEREFWTGTLAKAATPDWPNDYLANADTTTILASSAALAPLEALAALEQGIATATHGGRGMIHATPATVTHWANGGALRREGNLLLTVLDTIIVAGSGYTGSSPGAVAAANGAVWAYGTDLVDVRLGPVHTVPEDPTEAAPGVPVAALDRAVNTVGVYAWRAAAASWDGCAHVAVKLNISAAGL